MADSKPGKEAKAPTVFDVGLEQLGGTYAKALLGVTESAGNTDEVLDEFYSFVDVLGELPRLDAALESPRVPYEAKERLLNTALSGKATQQFLNFLKVVARHGRFACLRAILRSTQEQYNELRGRVAVQVVTAVTLDAAGTKKIAAKLKESLGKDVDIKASVDGSLIGGVVIRVGDKVFDGSVVNRLAQVRGRAITKTIQQIRDSIDRFEVA